MSDLFLALLHAGAIGIALSLAFSGYMIHAGLGDVPDGRSNHASITPTSGGVGLIAGLGGVLLGLSLFYPYFAAQPVLPRLLLVATAIAALGLWDDMSQSRAGLKLVLLGLLCILAAAIVSPVTALPFGVTEISLPLSGGAIGTALWIFVVVNAVNFMDGANGLMPSFMLLASLALFGIALSLNAPVTAILSASLAAGLLGFLPYNFKTKALIFCGDVGSLLAGFIFAVAVLTLVKEAPNARPLYVGPILFMPFLADVLMTLLRRAMRREHLMSPHRDHLYQRAIISGRSHKFMSLMYAFAGLICAVIAYLALETGLIRSLFGLMVLASGFGVFYYFAQRRLDRIIGAKA